MEELCKEIYGCGAQSTAGTGLGEMLAVKSSVTVQVKDLETRVCVCSRT